MDSGFFYELRNYIAATFDLMQNTIVFRAFEYNVSLWDCYTISTTLIAFFDTVIYPVLFGYHLDNDPEGSIVPDDDKDE